MATTKQLLHELKSQSMPDTPSDAPYDPLYLGMHGDIRQPIREAIFVSPRYQSALNEITQQGDKQ